MSTQHDDDNIILDEEEEEIISPTYQTEAEENAPEEDFRIEEEGSDDEGGKAQRNDDESEEEIVDATNAEDQKNIFSDIFGSESDEEEEIKRQIETAGAHEIISSDQRALPLRKYILPEFAGPHVDSDVYFFKAPSGLQIMEKRYSPDDTIEQDAMITHNVRWRYKTDEKGQLVRDDFGRPIMESNAKLVKWSDDTYQLYVGGAKATGADVAIYEVTKSSMMEQNHHLYSTTKQAVCSFDHGKFSHKLAFRPLNVQPPLKLLRTGLQETTRRKTQLTKARKLRDTELEESKRELNEMRNKIRQKRKRAEKKEQVNKLDVDFLEEDQGGQSLKQIKAKYRGAGKKKKAAKKGTKASRLRAQLEMDSDEDLEEDENLDEYEEDEEEYEEAYGDEGSDEDDEDPSWNPGRARKKQRQR